MPSAQKPPLRVLCLGDSLTAGSPSVHPYACKLRDLLKAAFATHDVHVANDGMPGDMVSDSRGTFHKRMKGLWRQREFEWTIVLGGTNDLVWSCRPDTLLNSLKELWDIPLSHGGKVLALTIPEINADIPGLEFSRKAVNLGIKNYKKQNFYAFDLAAAVPYCDMPAMDRIKYWDPDGVHFTRDGYDLIGQKVAECLIRILHLEEAQSTEISSIVTDARQRRMIEELIFEEERGDPKLLSQGYIIVRKRDLD
ncbi:hypothetical protein JX266_000304 [Neoarthrinium moseri]|uniref:uncharacterized protein n=1 Tax=Neoarthrinium moseri TaxID=1658444 RepID=UPI001FDDF60B|nr:uncharacterized protein JN550_003302 [Neoarthrinium moseri]KAI1855439.1 hypothetical protein JX266_000304 [Neoarthrinium moseri]KAI1873049.1 hypothetical protein JN550_003302 [Neoarthrinium moseri]